MVGFGKWLVIMFKSSYMRRTTRVTRGRIEWSVCIGVATKAL